MTPAMLQDILRNCSLKKKCGSCLIKLYLLFMEEETASIIIKCLKRYWEREKTVRFIMNKDTCN